MTIKKFALLSLFCAGTIFPLLAQPQTGAYRRAPGIITGQVWDAELATPIEYANVVLYRQLDTTRSQWRAMDTGRVVTGTITDAQGKFLLQDVPPGRFQVEISFIGYKTRRLDNVLVTPDGKVDLGRINLEQTALTMPEREVTAEKPRLEYRIDKKVINVAQDPALQSGTAVDVLEKVPSVKVDLEGNVTLRGLASFTVLIDGRPSQLEGNEALQQIPASTIERIELVTNPSVKYDPEGKAGIINVILKKQTRAGFSGILNLNAGNNNNFGGNMLLSLRQGIASFSIAPSINQMNFPGSRKSERWIKTPENETTFTTALGNTLFGGRFYGLRLGAEIQPNPQNYLGIGIRMEGRSGNRNQESDNWEWNSVSAETTAYKSKSSSINTGIQFSATIDASHNLGKKGHELTLRSSYGRNMHNDSTQTEDNTTDSLLDGRRTVEIRQGQRLDLKLDYTLPGREKDRFEAGYQTRLRFGPNATNRVAAFNPATGSYESLPQYSHTSNQKEQTHSLYATYSGNYKNFGALLGLRTEFTGRTVVIDDSSFSPLNRWNLFPSLHLSYQLPGENQLMASYTRRIDPPRGWDLAPVLTWMDAKNARQGNPNLKPEYIDSYEAGFLAHLGKHRVAVDGYCRFTHNLIERLQQPYQGSAILHTVANVGTDRALGVEANLDLAPFPWWNINLTGSIYDYRLILPDSTQKSFNYETGLTTDITLPTSTRFQFSLNYESPSASAQGTEAGHIWTNAAVRQALFNRQLLITFSVRDIFASSFHEDKTWGETFYSYNRLSRRGPMFSLGITYNLNNYRQQKRRQNSEEQEEEQQPLDYGY